LKHDIRQIDRAVLKLEFDMESVNRVGSEASVSFVPQTDSAQMINARQSFGGVDTLGLARDLQSIATRDPAAARALMEQISPLLTPVQQGELARFAAAGGTNTASPLSGFNARAQEIATRDPNAFGAILKQAFGDKLDPAMQAKLTAAAMNGTLPRPASIRFVSDDVLKGAQGAYNAQNGGTIYLNESLRSDPAALQSVVAHEMGHHLDAVIGAGDAKGEEGAVFAAGIEKGAPLSKAELEKAAESTGDRGTITVDGKKVEVEFVAPIVVWFGKAALETAPDVLIGALLAQLGVPYTAFDVVGDFLLNLVPVAGQAATVKKIAKIGEIISNIIDGAKLADKLPKEFKSAAIGQAQKIQKLWSDVQSQIAAGKFDQASSTWGSMIGYLRELQIASKISDNGGKLGKFGGTTLFNGKKVDIDVQWKQGEKLFFAEVKSGNDINLLRGDSKFTKKLANLDEKIATAKAYGAEFVLYTDNISKDMLEEVNKRGIQIVINNKFLGF
jgi:hypothetical protein